MLNRSEVQCFALLRYSLHRLSAILTALLFTPSPSTVPKLRLFAAMQPDLASEFQKRWMILRKEVTNGTKKQRIREPSSKPVLCNLSFQVQTSLPQ